MASVAAEADAGTEAGALLEHADVQTEPSTAAEILAEPPEAPLAVSTAGSASLETSAAEAPAAAPEPEPEPPTTATDIAPAPRALSRKVFSVIEEPFAEPPRAKPPPPPSRPSSGALGAGPTGLVVVSAAVSKAAAPPALASRTGAALPSGPSSAWPSSARIPWKVFRAFKTPPGLSPVVARALEKTQSLKSVVSELSERERVVGSALVRGEDLGEMEQSLGLKRAGLNETVSLLAFRLGVKGRSGIVRAFLGAGLVSPHQPLSLDPLNAMQRTMLTLFCEEQSEAEVADALHATTGAVSMRIRDLPSPWKASSRYKLEAMALSSGLLPPPGDNIPRLQLDGLSPMEKAAVAERVAGRLHQDPAGHLRTVLRKLELVHDWQLAPLYAVSNFSPSARPPPDLGQLDPLDTHLLRCLAAGWGLSRMASTLSLRERTVEERVDLFCQRLGFSNRLQAAHQAIRAGLGPTEAVSEAPWTTRSGPSAEWPLAMWRLPEGERAILELLARGESTRNVRIGLQLSDALFNERLLKIRSRTGVSTLEELTLRSALTFQRDTVSAAALRHAGQARELSPDTRALLEALFSALLLRQPGDPYAIITAMRSLALTPRPMRARLEQAARAIGFTLVLHPQEREVLDSQMALGLAVHALVHHGVGEQALLERSTLAPLRALNPSEKAVLDSLAQGKRPSELGQGGSKGSAGVLWATADELDCDEPYQLMALVLDRGALEAPTDIRSRREELETRVRQLPVVARDTFRAIAQGVPFEAIADRLSISEEKIRSRMKGWLNVTGLRTVAQIPGFVRALEWKHFQ